MYFLCIFDLTSEGSMKSPEAPAGGLYPTDKLSTAYLENKECTAFIDVVQ